MEHIIAKLLQEFEQGKMTRRQLIQSLALAATAAASGAAATAPAGNNVVKATYLNHISYQVANYARTRDFYADLFGMKVSNDNGKNYCRLAIGETLIAVRSRPPAPLVDHLCFTIANWDTLENSKDVKEAVGAELQRRGLETKMPPYYPQTFFYNDSYHIKDPDGFILQLGGTVQ
jgi:catechol 2,3-dioxygenase-like lactoylglutathione lyase family enzyme